MPTTPNLQITHVTEGQNQPEVTLDEALDLLDTAVAGHNTTSAVFPTDANLTPTAALMRASLSFVATSTGSLTATRDLIVPASAKLYFVRNSTTGGQSVRVKTSSGTGITIATATAQLLYCDGTNVVAVAAAV